MDMYNTSLALVCFTFTLHPFESINYPQDYLTAHNLVRAQVGVGPLTWSNDVAAYAKNYANKMIDTCGPIHTGGPYGENIVIGSSNDLTAEVAVGLWVAERPNYDHVSNTCIRGQVCGHYTQVVWRNTTRLGCARVRCNSGNNWVWWVICSYDPPGNSIGQRSF